MELLPNIHLVEHGGVNVYVITESTGLTIIDTGFADAVDPILGEIRQLGYKPEDVRRILLTHRHPDHIGGAASLHQATGANVLANELDADAISLHPKRSYPRAPVGTLMKLFAGKRFTPAPCPVASYLNPGDELPILGGLRVIPTPGHTYGHVSLYQPQRQVLFAGDAVMTMGGKIRMSPGFLCDDYAEACRTVRDIMAPLGAAHVLAGHGKPVLSGVADQFARLASRFVGM